MDNAIERSTMRKVYWRLLPLTMVMYFLCYIDRINVSFAALTMNKDIGLTAATYGFSSTAFYLGYVLCEMPSNLIMDKVGARLWLARIMVTWGLASAATSLVVGPTSFLVVRFLLGVGEAGLFPGVILLFTYWFPDAHRGRIVGLFGLALRSRWRLARRSPPPSWRWTASWGSRAGSGSTFWRRFPPSSSDSSCCS